MDHSGEAITPMVSRAYKERIPMCLLISMRSSVYTTEQAVKPNRVGSVDLRSVDPSAAQRSRKSLTATTVPSLRSKTMPTLSAKSIRQDPCQVEKIFWWGQLTPAVSQSVRGQENIITTSLVTMRDHYTKTAIQASELTMPLMEIDSRT
mgnify:CR=1 FL=1